MKILRIIILTYIITKKSTDFNHIIVYKESNKTNFNDLCV